MKWILRYLKSITNIGLIYKKHKETTRSVVGYVDSNYIEDLDKRRSWTGYVFILGRYTISWKATLQSFVALSITEVEYIEPT